MRRRACAPLALILLGMAGAPGGPAARAQEAALLATWRDGEIREVFDATTRESRVFVAVMPEGAQGSLTVVLSARWPGRTRTKPLDTFELRADVGLRVNPNLIRQPTMVLMLDPDAATATALDLSDRLVLPPRGAGSSIDTGTVRLSIVELIQLLRARTLRAEIFTMPLSFTPSQLEALRRFGDRVLAPPQGAH